MAPSFGLNWVVSRRLDDSVSTLARASVEVPGQVELRVQVDVAVTRFEVTDGGVGAVGREVSASRDEVLSRGDR